MLHRYTQVDPSHATATKRPPLATQQEAAFAAAPKTMLPASALANLGMTWA